MECKNDVSSTPKLFPMFQISLILKALEDGGVTLDESGQIRIPWSLNFPTMPEKSWEVHEDISDKLEDAEQLISYFQKGKPKPPT